MTRLRLLAAALATPLVLWLFVPVLSDGEPLRLARSSEKQPEIEAQEAAGARPDVDDPGLLAAHRRAAGRHRRRCQRARCGSRPTSPPSASELAGAPGRAARRARPAHPAARPARRVARACSATGSSTLYKADKPDVVTVVLDSDGFADLLERARVHASASPTRTGGSSTASATPRRTSVAADAAARRARGAASSEVTAIVAQRAATRSREIKDGLVEPPRRACRTSRAGKQQRARLASAPTATSSRTTSPRSRRSRRRSPRGSPASTSSRAGPVQQGSGRFIWPVNGPITSPFGYRWGRLHAGIDIAVPEGTPLRAADGGTRRDRRLDRRLRQLHLHPATAARSPPATATSRGSRSRSARASARARSSATPATPATRPARTCTSRSAINGSPVDPMGYL